MAVRLALTVAALLGSVDDLKFVLRCAFVHGSLPASVLALSVCSVFMPPQHTDAVGSEKVFFKVKAKQIK